jgi:type IV secretion system protein VirB3
MNNHRSELKRVVIHRSPVRLIMLMGAERNLVIFSVMFCTYMTYLICMRYSVWLGVGVGGSFWLVSLFLLRRLAKIDPQMWQVFNRHIKYKAFYPARGRFDAPYPIPRTF